MSFPNPALVSRREAAPLPRVALLLFCAAYVLPGVFGRDPWRTADITAFGYIVAIADGRTPWWSPAVGGLAGDSALLPYWLGAAFVKLLPWLEPSLAARIPFALLLVGVLVCTWYAAYHLARSESAQPLPFAFGGEADPVDYARAIADGALLALIACLGLLQLGHETTPELAQLAAVALFLYGLAASPQRPRGGAVAVALALPALAGSGAPSVAIVLAAAGGVPTWLSARSPPGRSRPLALALCVGTVLALVAATALGAWSNRLAGYGSVLQVLNLFRLVAWFAWPAWLLAVWTLWQWRRRLGDRHIVVPSACALALLAAWAAMAGADRALMLALPPIAVLAAFALPTLQRSAAAAIDWFSVAFFTIAAITGWVIYVSMQTGFPPKPAANMAKLSPGYVNSFSWIALACAAFGTIAWLWLVYWRGGRRRHPFWKSLVLPAGGVSLCWLLVMTLLLPPLDNARSYRSLVQRIARVVPAGACIAAPGMQRGQVIALQHHGGWRVDAVTPAAATACPYLLLAAVRSVPGKPSGPWQFVVRERRSRGAEEVTDVYRRAGSAS